MPQIPGFDILFSGCGLGDGSLGGRLLSCREFASPSLEVTITVYGAPRVGGSLESCGTSGVPIGRESLAVAPYLMDPATVLLERFAKRCTHGVLTPPGFAGYGLGLLDSLRSSQLNNPFYIK